MHQVRGIKKLDRVILEEYRSDLELFRMKIILAAAICRTQVYNDQYYVLKPAHRST